MSEGASAVTPVGAVEVERAVEVAVVGGGAVGVTTAHDLAVRGASATLYERGAVADGASGRAAGVCYDAYADRIDAELGERALDRFREFSGTGAFEFVDCPYVILVREGDERRAEAIREGVARMRDHDRDVSLVDPTTLGGEFPDLRTDDVLVAAVARNAGYTDPGAYTAAMADEAREAGVEVREGTTARLLPGEGGPTVETDDGHEDFDAVLVAAGAHSRQVLADAGHPIPLKPYRVQALVTEADPITDRAPMCYDASGGYYLRPREGGLLVGDGCESRGDSQANQNPWDSGDGTELIERDPDDWDRDADDWFVADCAGYLETAFGRSYPVDRAWAGLCTATPDGHPLFGERAPGLYVAAGWQGHGFMRAPAMAERMADQMLGGDGIDAFDPNRFDGDEQFDIVEGMELD
ncbi:NAD(P)/FAD-dependent oxidoreductase [Halomarina oriensis]|uniref:FAD-dependent oxidoreductase n=1 Tax=Halomarina oriensis TaxID=671145 RepID=A0A6B0GKM4_9EURY|nr:FAD-binding oxidoreductase [Halomarina oriensis]MWG35412.1 FAD-dependent oxidoreductase [Halomarina oriensis]